MFPRQPFGCTVRQSPCRPRGNSTTHDTSEHYVYEGNQVSLILDDGGEVRHRYLHGPGTDALLADEVFGATGDHVETYWTATDHAGSVRDVLENNYNLVNHLEYDAFGDIEAVWNPYKVEVDLENLATDVAFAGRHYDADTGLYYNRARWYDADLGRFISADPIGFGGGDSNLYRYAGNDPVNYGDPSGLFGEGFSFDTSNMFNLDFDFSFDTSSFLDLDFGGLSTIGDFFTGAITNAGQIFSDIGSTLGTAGNSLSGAINTGISNFASAFSGQKKVSSNSGKSAFKRAFGNHAKPSNFPFHLPTAHHVEMQAYLNSLPDDPYEFDAFYQGLSSPEKIVFKARVINFREQEEMDLRTAKAASDMYLESLSPMPKRYGGISAFSQGIYQTGQGEAFKTAGMLAGQLNVIGAATAEIVAAFTVPGVGELQDAAVIADPHAPTWHKWVSGVSLGVGAALGGWGPNAGTFLRGFRSADNGANVVGGVARAAPKTGLGAVGDTVARTPQAAQALNRKLSALQTAQQKAVRTRTLPDGRTRYYLKESPARNPGPTRGRSHVTEYDPRTGRVRAWEETYDHAGKVNRVHPKMLNGEILDLPHYPLTAKELGL